MLYIRAIPTYGMYTILFFRSVMRFAYFLVLFFLFIFSFSMTFYAQLRNQVPFRHLGEAVMKTIVMVIGELDYGNMFHNRFSKDIPMPIENQIAYVGLTYVTMIAFLVMMCIIFMNMLTAITVDDMNEVRMDIQYLQLKMQSSFCLRVERYLPNSILQHRAIDSFKWKRNKFFPFHLLYPVAPDSKLVCFD
ncbi:hypothetical protein Ciccas_013561 [Cichlidogyrus casuarinus]|uniref:Ion transport domain-containing protein n=1 Tax=Cichlidogyrus casuarinus TaxID=1844966 RepID=A0ABD2PL09_9PLAT